MARRDYYYTKPGDYFELGSSHQEDANVKSELL